jgi:hypothetical protein
VAEGCNHAQIIDNSVHLEAKYYFSQDGVKWIDLPAVDAGVVKFAASLRSQLSGDPSKVYPESTGEEEQQQEDAQQQGSMVITELQRLRAMIDSINGDTGILPVVSTRPPEVVATMTLVACLKRTRAAPQQPSCTLLH